MPASFRLNLPAARGGPQPRVAIPETFALCSPHTCDLGSPLVDSAPSLLPREISISQSRRRGLCPSTAMTSIPRCLSYWPGIWLFAVPIVSVYVFVLIGRRFFVGNCRSANPVQRVCGFPSFMIFAGSTILADVQDSSDKQSFPGKRFENFGNSLSYGGFDLFRMRQQRVVLPEFDLTRANEFQ
jgi:hypothetical protein